MSIWFPRSVSAEATSGTDMGQTITGESTAHVKGAWTQIQAALPFDGFFIQAVAKQVRSSGVETKVMCDIGVDPAGGTSYTVYVPNILFGFVDTGNISPASFGIPLYIPSGSTIAARIQGSVTSETASIGAYVYGGTPSDNPYPVQGLVVDYGTTTSSSSGISPTNASADTEGAWTEIVASTTHPHRGVSVAVQGADSTLANARLFVDVGVGASSSEVAIFEGIFFNTGGIEQLLGPIMVGPIERPIPEGSRLSARLQSNSANQGANIEVALYGWG